MKRSFKDWLIAPRPWSAPVSVMPIIATTAYLFFRFNLMRNGLANLDIGTLTGWSWWNALIALPMLVCLHFSANLISDYFDHIRGVDLPDSLNGVRTMYSGLFQPKEIRNLGFAFLAVGTLLGMWILARTSWSYILLGAIGIVMAAFYTTFKYHALGDLDVLLGFSVLPSMGISLIVAGEIFWDAVLFSLPYGLLTCAVLQINNTRDIRNDRRAGITTMQGLTGGRFSQWLYAAELTLPYLLVLVYTLLTLAGCLPFRSMTQGIGSRWLALLMLLTFINIPASWKLLRSALKAQPEEELPIATHDQQTAQLQLKFGLIYTLAFFVAGIIL